MTAAADSIDQNILAKIKKVLALRDKNTDENEAANAAAFAQELLFKYNIAEEDVTSAHIEKEEAYERQFYRNHMRGSRVIEWKIKLAFTVAQANLCTMVYHDNGAVLAWLGKPSNIAVGQFLYETLMADLIRIADEKWKQIEALRKLEMQYNVDLFKPGSELRSVHGKTWKNSFYFGAIEIINDRLNGALKQLQEGDTKIGALVVSNRIELKDFMSTIYGKLGKHTKEERIYSHSGYMSGRDAGKNVTFKKGVGAGGSLAPNLLKG